MLWNNQNILMLLLIIQRNINIENIWCNKKNKKKECESICVFLILIVKQLTFIYLLSKFLSQLMLRIILRILLNKLLPLKLYQGHCWKGMKPEFFKLFQRFICQIIKVIKQNISVLEFEATYFLIFSITNLFDFFFVFVSVNI